MIISRLMGGHSNQLFQYAVGRSLALGHNTNLLLDVSWFEEAVDVESPRDYELGVYPLQARTTKLKGLHIIDPKQPIGRKLKLASKLQPKKTVTMHYENDMGYNRNIPDLPDNTMLVGFWQNERYFAHIRPQLLKELEPTNPLSKVNQSLIKEMQATESVWMHIRRGDYVTSKLTQDFHGLKDLEYYQKSLETLLKKLPANRQEQVAIFVCSNDIPWCKQNLKLGFPIKFVENKLGSDDMRVVKHCKHDILANSSFSWWGAWLNQNPDKIVIAPKQWFRDKKANDEIDIVPKEWIKL